MAQEIKFKRGTFDQLEGAATLGTLVDGEPYFIDGTSLYIGSGPTSYIQACPVSVPLVTNPGDIYVSQQKTFNIVNFDGFFEYSAAADSGVASVSASAITYTAPDEGGEDTLSISCNGVVRKVNLTIKEAEVVKPTLTSPVADSTISCENITITTSAFATALAADVHIETQYTIESASGTVYYNLVTSTNLETITIPFPNIGWGKERYVYTRHRGEALGWSDWSDATKINTIPLSRGLRVGGKATILGNPDGSPFTINGSQVWIAVIDAAYRGTSIKFGAYGFDASIPNMAGTTIYEGDSETVIDSKTTVTLSSKVMTDTFMTQVGVTDGYGIVGVPACEFCRAVPFLNSACDCPNYKSLARIWVQRAFIDENDPTLATNASKALSAWGFGSSGGTRVWSCSETSANGTIGMIDTGGCVGYFKYGIYGVLPIFTISAT